MKWEPKPFIMKGWDFKFEKGEAVMIPNFEDLHEKISDAARELSREIARTENALILRSLSDDSLKTLAKICKEELKKREKARKDFKL